MHILMQSLYYADSKFDGVLPETELYIYDDHFFERLDGLLLMHLTMSKLVSGLFYENEIANTPAKVRNN